MPPFTSTVPYATESSRVSFAPFSTTIFTLESTFMLCSVTSAPAGMVSVSVPKFPFSPLPMVPYVPDSCEPYMSVSVVGTVALPVSEMV